MTIIRNRAELAAHNRRTDEVWKNHPAEAARCREEHALLLVDWLLLSPEEQEAFNDFFGPPPREDTITPKAIR